VQSALNKVEGVLIFGPWTFGW